MLNVYLIYVSSLETGDVEISRKVYTSHGKAIDDIESMIQQYVSNRKSENAYKIISKEDFDVKKLNRDPEIPIGGYVFKQKKSDVCIYKKVVVEGRVWNGSKLQKVGKMGILPEINIPIDRKLLKLIETIQENNTENNTENIIETTNGKIRYDIPEAPKAPESNTHDSEINAERDEEEYRTSLPGPSNYEHGKHVSFIQELKSKLQDRNNSELKINIDIVPAEIGRSNANHLQFISNLEAIRSKLNHITPPSSPKLGRVLENIVESPSPEIPDFPDVPDFPDFPDISDLPPCPASPDLSIEVYSETSNDISIDLTESSDWDSSEEIIDSEIYTVSNIPRISDSNIVYKYFTNSHIKREKHIIPAPPQTDYASNHIEQIVESIIKTINLNNKDSDLADTKDLDLADNEDSIDSEITENSLLPMPSIEYDEDMYLYRDNEWEFVEYSEDIWSDSLRKYKYQLENKNRRTSF